MNHPRPDITSLHSLIREWENECVEFKEANDNFPTSDIGKYFSALANEANLRNRSSAWLVFGVNNKTRETIGTTYRMDRDRLHSLKKLFQNAGSFIDGTPEDYIATNKTPTRYRNRFLTTAMVNLRMIDKMGFGIHDVMFRGQARRFLPLPEYDTSAPAHVILTLPGRFIDENYSKALMAHPDLSFSEIRALDLIQKGHPLTGDHLITLLKKKNLIEGRKPNFHLTSSMAHSREQRADYIKNRAFDDPYYCDLILNYLNQYGQATRSDLDILLREKLSSTLSELQKTNKVKNLIMRLKREGKIIPQGKTKQAVWIPANPSQS